MGDKEKLPIPGISKQKTKKEKETVFINQIEIYFSMDILTVGNGMLHHSFGGVVICFSLHHFFAPVTDLMPCLQAQVTRDCIKGIEFKKSCNETLSFFKQGIMLYWTFLEANAPSKL